MYSKVHNSSESGKWSITIINAFDLMRSIFMQYLRERNFETICLFFGRQSTKLNQKFSLLRYAIRLYMSSLTRWGFFSSKKINVTSRWPRWVSFTFWETFSALMKAEIFCNIEQLKFWIKERHSLRFLGKLKKASILLQLHVGLLSTNQTDRKSVV